MWTTTPQPHTQRCRLQQSSRHEVTGTAIVLLLLLLSQHASASRWVGASGERPGGHESYDPQLARFLLQTDQGLPTAPPPPPANRTGNATRSASSSTAEKSGNKFSAFIATTIAASTGAIGVVSGVAGVAAANLGAGTVIQAAGALNMQATSAALVNLIQHVQIFAAMDAPVQQLALNSTYRDGLTKNITDALSWITFSTRSARCLTGAPGEEPLGDWEQARCLWRSGKNHVVVIAIVLGVGIAIHALLVLLWNWTIGFIKPMPVILVPPNLEIMLAGVFILPLAAATTQLISANTRQSITLAAFVIAFLGAYVLFLVYVLLGVIPQKHKYGLLYKRSASSQKPASTSSSGQGGAGSAGGSSGGKAMQRTASARRQLCMNINWPQWHGEWEVQGVPEDDKPNYRKQYVRTSRWYGFLSRLHTPQPNPEASTVLSVELEDRLGGLHDPYRGDNILAYNWELVKLGYLVAQGALLAATEASLEVGAMSWSLLWVQVVYTALMTLLRPSRNQWLGWLDIVANWIRVGTFIAFIKLSNKHEKLRKSLLSQLELTSIGIELLSTWVRILSMFIKVEGIYFAIKKPKFLTWAHRSIKQTMPFTADHINRVEATAAEVERVRSGRLPDVAQDSSPLLKPSGATAAIITPQAQAQAQAQKPQGRVIDPITKLPEPTPVTLHPAASGKQEVDGGPKPTPSQQQQAQGRTQATAPQQLQPTAPQQLKTQEGRKPSQGQQQQAQGASQPTAPQQLKTQEGRKPSRLQQQQTEGAAQSASPEKQRVAVAGQLSTSATSPEQVQVQVAGRPRPAAAVPPGGKPDKAHSRPASSGPDVAATAQLPEVSHLPNVQLPEREEEEDIGHSSEALAVPVAIPVTEAGPARAGTRPRPSPLDPTPAPERLGDLWQSGLAAHADDVTATTPQTLTNPTDALSTTSPTPDRTPTTSAATSTATSPGTAGTSAATSATLSVPTAHASSPNKLEGGKPSLASDSFAVYPNSSNTADSGALVSDGKGGVSTRPAPTASSALPDVPSFEFDHPATAGSKPAAAVGSQAEAGAGSQAEAGAGRQPAAGAGSQAEAGAASPVVPRLQLGASKMDQPSFKSERTNMYYSVDSEFDEGSVMMGDELGLQTPAGGQPSPQAPELAPDQDMVVDEILKGMLMDIMSSRPNSMSSMVGPLAAGYAAETAEEDVEEALKRVLDQLQTVGSDADDVPPLNVELLRLRLLHLHQDLLTSWQHEPTSPFRPNSPSHTVSLQNPDTIHTIRRAYSTRIRHMPHTASQRRAIMRPSHTMPAAVSGAAADEAVAAVGARAPAQLSRAPVLTRSQTTAGGRTSDAADAAADGVYRHSQSMPAAVSGAAANEAVAAVGARETAELSRAPVITRSQTTAGARTTAAAAQAAAGGVYRHSQSMPPAVAAVAAGAADASRPSQLPPAADVTEGVGSSGVHQHSQSMPPAAATEAAVASGAYRHSQSMPAASIVEAAAVSDASKESQLAPKAAAAAAAPGAYGRSKTMPATAATSSAPLTGAHSDSPSMPPTAATFAAPGTRSYSSSPSTPAAVGTSAAPATRAYGYSPSMPASVAASAAAITGAYSRSPSTPGTAVTSASPRSSAYGYSPSMPASVAASAAAITGAYQQSPSTPATAEPTRAYHHSYTMPGRAPVDAASSTAAPAVVASTPFQSPFYSASRAPEEEEPMLQSVDEGSATESVADSDLSRSNTAASSSTTSDTSRSLKRSQSSPGSIASSLKNRMQKLKSKILRTKSKSIPAKE